MKSNEIKDILLKSYYPKGRHFCTTNFSGCGLHECDVIMVTEKFMVYEYEIKCSYSDFKADFKKIDKHQRLSGTNKPVKFTDVICDDSWYLNNTGTIGKPNYFTYVCEEGIIPLSEVPSYAGLIYIINGEPIVIKRSSKLHNIKCSEKLIFQICRNLTARMIYGCSYMNYKNNLIH